MNAGHISNVKAIGAVARSVGAGEWTGGGVTRHGKEPLTKKLPQGVKERLIYAASSCSLVMQEQHGVYYMSNAERLPGMLAESLDYWKNMSNDEWEDYDQIPPVLREHIARLAFYAHLVPQLLEALRRIKIVAGNVKDDPKQHTGALFDILEAVRGVLAALPANPQPDDDQEEAA